MVAESLSAFFRWLMASSLSRLDTISQSENGLNLLLGSGATCLHESLGQPAVINKADRKLLDCLEAFLHQTNYCSDGIEPGMTT